jgi:hypothetical protein
VPNGSSLVSVAVRSKSRVGQDAASNRALENFGNVFGVRCTAGSALVPWTFEQLRKELNKVTHFKLCQYTCYKRGDVAPPRNEQRFEKSS